MLTMEEIKRSMDFGDKALDNPNITEYAGSLKVLAEGYRKIAHQLLAMLEEKNGRDCE